MTHLYFHKKSFRNVLIILLLTFVFMTACQSASSKPNTMTPGTDMTDMSHDEDMASMDMEADHDTAMRQFVPNDGAEVRITAPANGAIIKSSDNVPVTIETTDFTIGEDGNHWHIYIDGDPIMVMGGNTFVLQNLSAGPHDIQVYLSNGHHEDLEQGDSVTILVGE